MSDIDLFTMFVRLFGLKPMRFQVACDFDISYVWTNEVGTLEWAFYFDPDTGSLLEVLHK